MLFLSTTVHPRRAGRLLDVLRSRTEVSHNCVTSKVRAPPHMCVCAPSNVYVRNRARKREDREENVSVQCHLCMRRVCVCVCVCAIHDGVALSALCLCAHRASSRSCMSMASVTDNYYATTMAIANQAFY